MAKHMENQYQARADFHEAYPALFSSLTKYFTCRVAVTADCDDLLGETFLEAWRSLHTYNKEKAALNTWVFQIAKRRLARYWAARNLPIEFTDDLERRVDALTQTTSAHIDTHLAATLLLEKLEQTLTPEELALCHMRFVDGLSFTEISERTGRSHGSLRTWLSRLRKRRHEYIHEINNL